MSVANYKKLIAEQLVSGIITVRCPCGEPAVDWAIGGVTCALCIKRDDVRVREYNKAEAARRQKQEQTIIC